MSPGPQPLQPHRLDHVTSSDARRYAVGIAEENEKRVIEEHITACSECLLKLRLAMRASA